MNKLVIILSLFVISNVYSESLQEKLDLKKTQSKASKDVREKIKRAIDDLKRSRIEEKSLQMGRVIPDFEIDGKPIKEYYKHNFLIIKFYRGHWCPYCMIELQEYEKFYPEFQKKGAKLIALVPDTYQQIGKTKKRFNLTFPIYRDKNNEIAKKFGLAFKLDQEILKIYKRFGINLSESQGNLNNELPMPGTYLVNKNGRIIYAFVDADYTKRLDPRVLLKKYP